MASVNIVAGCYYRNSANEPRLLVIETRTVPSWATFWAMPATGTVTMDSYTGNFHGMYGGIMPWTYLPTFQALRIEVPSTKDVTEAQAAVVRSLVAEEYRDAFGQLSREYAEYVLTRIEANVLTPPPLAHA